MKKEGAVLFGWVSGLHRDYPGRCKFPSGFDLKKKAAHPLCGYKSSTVSIPSAFLGASTGARINMYSVCVSIITY
ncbi:hypothetical protein [Sporolactobacillus nakayamae]|uniref:hypothetical protein n=1 Tax=Sporolactobacillus nakayamae TaxID=269670 RepID=UPI0011603B9B|nr:hypothetical protein [Sporolactobacillus nakayamae]